MKKEYLHMYLTDEQYLDLMKKIRKDIDGVTEIFAEDSTMIGNKYTITNIGLCAEAFDEKGSVFSKSKYVTRETAMWPKDFDKIGKVKYDYPQMFAMKYRQSNQLCPLDKRNKGGFNGCFYTCRAFKDKTLTMQEVKCLYDEAIQKEENKQKRK